MTAMRVAIVDDESLARARLERFLAAVPDVEVVVSCSSAAALLEALKTVPVDALWLDIHMPELSGVELATLLRERDLPVVFVTAHPQHALEAFAVEAVDYILKPVEPARVSEAAARLRRHCQGALQQLAIETANGVVLVQPDHISHAIFDGELTTLYLAPEATTEQLHTTWSLSALAERLPTGQLERVHRRHLLSLRHVARLERTPTGGYIAWMQDGSQVEVSRQAGRSLKRRFGW